MIKISGMLEEIMLGGLIETTPQGFVRWHLSATKRDD